MSKSIRDFVVPHIRNMAGYVPGLQLNQQNLLKLNTNENPFVLPDSVLADLELEVQRNRMHLYPSPDSKLLRERLGEAYGVGAESVFVGNGSDEILRNLMQLFLDEGESVVVLDPSYSLYPVLAELCNRPIEKIPLKDDWTADLFAMLHSAAKMALITNPNAPTGIELSRTEILDFVTNFNRPVLVDEAYAAFGHSSVMAEAGKISNLLVCSTFSKAFSLAGLRVGWLVAHPDLIRELDKIRDSYNVSGFSQAAAVSVLKHRSIIKEQCAEISRVRDWFVSALNDIGFETLPSSANFVFTRPPSADGKAVYDFLLDHNVLVRHFSADRIRPFVRISVGLAVSMQRVADLLAEGVRQGRF